jgi:hypothetical protein
MILSHDDLYEIVVALSRLAGEVRPQQPERAQRIEDLSRYMMKGLTNDSARTDQDTSKA